jgi:hypothetical protein
MEFATRCHAEIPGRFNQMRGENSVQYGTGPRDRAGGAAFKKLLNFRVANPLVGFDGLGRVARALFLNFGVAHPSHLKGGALWFEQLYAC